MTRFLGLIDDEAERSWRVSAGLARILFLLPLVGSVLVILSRASKPVFRELTNEDHILEWAQVAFYASAAVLAVLIALAVLRSSRAIAALWFLFAILLVFVTGEEIDWGQRYFHFKTGLEGANEQAETTIHNLGSATNVVFATGLAIVALYGLVVPWALALRSRPSGGARQRLVVPPLFLTTAFAIVFGYRFLRWVYFTEDRYTVVHLQEWPELCFAFAAAAFAFLNLRLLRAEPGPPADVTSGRLLRG